MYARGWWSRGALLLAGALLASCASSPHTQDPASTSRTLSQEEVDGLLLGMGLGMAAPAEINGYPGPRHVLDLKDELALTPDQRFATSRLLGQMLGHARALGQRIVEAERRLDADMAGGELSGPQVKARIETIASLRAQLRYTHIDAHLKQKKILTPEQVVRYYELRGREVHVPPPATLAQPIEPLVLPAVTAPVSAPESVNEFPAGGIPAGPTVIPVPVLVPIFEDSAPVKPEPALEEEFEPAPQYEETVEPVVAPLPPAEAPKGLTPGMQDALEEADPAPVTIQELPTPAREPAPVMKDVERVPAALSPGVQDAMEEAEPMVAPVIKAAPALPPTSTREVIAPVTKDVEHAPAVLSPGVQDALEEAEPVAAPEVIKAAPALPPSTRTVAPTPVSKPTPVIEEAVEAAPATLSPGMQDAMEDLEPVAQPAIQPAVAPPVTPAKRTAPVASTKAARPVRERHLSPGAQDAMELAEPAANALEPVPEAADVFIAPLEDEIEELPAIDTNEPVMIDLDN